MGIRSICFFFISIPNVSHETSSLARFPCATVHFIVGRNGHHFQLSVFLEGAGQRVLCPKNGKFLGFYARPGCRVTGLKQFAIVRLATRTRAGVNQFHRLARCSTASARNWTRLDTSDERQEHVTESLHFAPVWPRHFFPVWSSTFNQGKSLEISAMARQMDIPRRI